MALLGEWVPRLVYMYALSICKSVNLEYDHKSATGNRPLHMGMDLDLTLVFPTPFTVYFFFCLFLSYLCSFLPDPRDSCLSFPRLHLFLFVNPTASSIPLHYSLFIYSMYDWCKGPRACRTHYYSIKINIFSPCL